MAKRKALTGRELNAKMSDMLRVEKV